MLASEAFADDSEVEAMLNFVPRTSRIATDRDAGYLRWRYSFEPLHYRVVPLKGSISDGAIVYRLRRRGAALEATIAEVFAPQPGVARSAMTQILRATNADYAILGGQTTPSPRASYRLPDSGRCRRGNRLAGPGYPASPSSAWRWAMSSCSDPAEVQ